MFLFFQSSRNEGSVPPQVGPRGNSGSSSRPTWAGSPECSDHFLVDLCDSDASLHQCDSSAVYASATEIEHGKRCRSISESGLAAAIRRVREEHGINQEEAAERCGLHRTYYSGIERGVRNVSLVNIEKVSRGLKIPLHELFRRV